MADEKSSLMALGSGAVAEARDFGMSLSAVSSSTMLMTRADMDERDMRGGMPGRTFGAANARDATSDPAAGVGVLGVGVTSNVALAAGSMRLRASAVSMLLRSAAAALPGLPVGGPLRFTPRVARSAEDEYVLIIACAEAAAMDAGLCFDADGES